ncbi:cytochrome P450 [Pleurotus eryngii]|uniref:Cytochrome P450 n=1 Tax=Pleurotus eryngii TaxID=5323 RepID=A0A9P5ZYC5_PLEER|nr:cytochrome P450 [Pleurotus eryngii]
MSAEDTDSTRIEVEQTLEQEGGWTKSALNKFTKIDSIVRDIARFHGLTSFGISRRTITDGFLSDGVVIPAGYEVAFDLRRIHFNPEVYRDPYRFDPFRFSKIRAETGRHVCPGRFFASVQLKVIITNFLLNYDTKIPADQTTRPKNVVFAGAIFPPLNAHLLVKPRRGNMA